MGGGKRIQPCTIKSYILILPNVLDVSETKIELFPQETKGNEKGKGKEKEKENRKSN
jgi:hypothetical protein